LSFDLAATLPDRERDSSTVMHQLQASVASAAGDTGLPGRYDDVRMLGMGSSGRVFSARDLTFDRVVAVKVLGGGDGPATARFIREARITAAIEHPNVVPVYDLEFTPAGTIYFTMRRVQGMSLGDALRQAVSGEMPSCIATINDRITIIRQVCSALSRAHASGIIHQDVKPDNIMLGEHGEVVLVDWGEARVRGDSRDGLPCRSTGTPAYMSPEQARGERADERSDVYCVGATLFHALVLRHPLWDDVPERFWERKRQGLIDPLTMEERRRMPRRLWAVVEKALAADRTARYPTIRAFEADLTAYQAGQAISAYHESWLERSVRWTRDHQRALLLGGVGAVLLGGIVATIWGERLQEIASWGMPVLVEDFSDDTWRTHLSEVAPGMFELRNGELVSTANNAALLFYRERITGGVAIEYAAEMKPEGNPCDISVAWHSGDSLPTDPQWQWSPDQHGMLVQVGGYFNTGCMVVRLPSRQRLTQVPFHFEPGRRYQVRVEFDERHVHLIIDGRRILDYEQDFPHGPGYIGLYGFMPGKAFDDVRIYRKGVAEKISVLGIGDSHAQRGRFADAADEYHLAAESHPGTALAEEARWREGLARQAAGNDEDAFRAWADIRAPDLRTLVEVKRLDRQRQAGDWFGACSGFAVLYRNEPHARDALRLLWNDWILAIKRQTYPSPAIADACLSLKTAWFPEDASTSDNACDLLDHFQRYDEILTRYPDNRLWVGYALVRIGRANEAIRRFPDIRPVFVQAQMDLGHFAELVDSPRVGRTTWSWALCKMRRSDEAEHRFGISVASLLAQGRLDEALRQPGLAPFELAAVLWASGRDRPLAGDDGSRFANLPEAPLFADDPAIVRMAHVPGRRIDQVLAILHHQRGEHDQELLARTRISVRAIDPLLQTDWFDQWFMPAWLDHCHGDSRPLQALLDTALTTHRLRFAGRLSHAAAFLRHQEDATTFLAQPCRDEADAWLALFTGVRGELDGDHAAALAGYRAWFALPRWHRLFGNQEPDPVAERFVAWRLQELEAGK
jgi:tetratricopeptide (TPR) repeat protein